MIVHHHDGGDGDGDGDSINQSPKIIAHILIKKNTEFIEEQLQPFKPYGEDTIYYQNWVEVTASAKGPDKKERDKLKKFEKRLIAVAKYRVFIAKKSSFGGSRTVCIYI